VGLIKNEYMCDYCDCYEKYKALIASGMAWEFHPWLTGNWKEDKERYIKEIYEVYENTKN
jgi:hypothetical protein